MIQSHRQTEVSDLYAAVGRELHIARLSVPEDYDSGMGELQSRHIC